MSEDKNVKNTFQQSSANDGLPKEYTNSFIANPVVWDMVRQQYPANNPQAPKAPGK